MTTELVSSNIKVVTGDFLTMPITEATDLAVIIVLSDRGCNSFILIGQAKNQLR